MKKFVGLALAVMLFATAAFSTAEGVQVLTATQTGEFALEGVKLVTTNASFPQITGLANADAMYAVNSAIRAEIESEFAYQGVCDLAVDDYTVAGRNFKDNTYDVMVIAGACKQTDRLLSVFYNFEGYFGGAHGDHWGLSQHFDLSSGAEVLLGEMVADPEVFHETVVNEVLAIIASSDTAAKNDYFEGYEESVRDWTLDRASLEERGLTVFFNPSEIGPYASGSQYFTIGYDKLADQWNDLGKALLGL